MDGRRAFWRAGIDRWLSENITKSGGLGELGAGVSNLCTMSFTAIW